MLINFSLKFFKKDGVNLDDEDEDDNGDEFVDAASGLSPSASPGGRFKFKSVDSDDSFDYHKINHIKNKDVLLPHLLVHWKDAKLYNRVTLFVWCLSGLEPSDLNAKILAGGTTLSLRFNWPDPLQDSVLLTRDAYCRDSSKVVEMETIFKAMKNGAGDSVISSEVEFELGMQVEEEFHNEVIGRGKLEKGNKLLRFFKDYYRSKTRRREKIPNCSL